MKFRKKPVVVDAIEWTGDWKPIIDWLDELAGGTFRITIGGKPPIYRNPDNNSQLLIATLEGVMWCPEGHWIICGVNGEFYPCAPDIFRKTYELVVPELKSSAN